MTEPAAWDYGRSLPPHRWSELPDFNGGCSPSPIRLNALQSTKNCNLGVIKPDYVNDDAIKAAMKGFFFESLHFEIVICEHKNAGRIYIGNNPYELIKLHFHTPSEHTIDGAFSKMEVHLVHADPNSAGVVVAIMVEELTPEHQAQGHSASPIMKFFHSLLPEVTLPPVEKHVEKAIIEPNSLNGGFPKKMSYFTYQGGLTTPPCTEPVFFYVLDTPIYTTHEIIKKFSHYVPGGNNRPLQPDYGRKVEYFPG